MAFDGITIAAVRAELENKIVGGKINKIAQPEADELILTVKNNRTQYRLLLSANASLPLIYLTESNKLSPMTAPNFCMLLRKHIGSGKILSVTQPSLERVLVFDIEHLNELGDICRKKLMVEIMGKHSNIIFCSEDDRIIDSIKHVSANMSSVREVLPGRAYFIPETQNKKNPYTISETEFKQSVLSKPMSCAKALYTSITGLSPVMGEEICYRAKIEGGLPADALDEISREHLYHTFMRLMEDVSQKEFRPNIIYEEQEPVEYAALQLTQYGDFKSQGFDSISQVLEQYYAMKNRISRIRQKSVDLRKVVTTALERNVKKLNIQEKQMADTKKKDKYRIYGELLNTYGYETEQGAKSLEALNYYTGELITIPLDETLNPSENAKKYFERYNKLKRTAEALDVQLGETREEISHLESVRTSLDIALEEEDLVQIKEELVSNGYIRRKGPAGKRVKITSRPFHYISSDGYDIYVGKNNIQNEELSFKLATGNDWWFHAKGCPGSHVIVKCGPDGEMPDRTFEEAGRLAAYYSGNKTAPKVEIDYTQKKNLRKPGGSKPGFVVYYTNYSLHIEPDITGIRQIN
ncbi:Rqc2 family fibronectin-binding protein [Novisyntrophococcus fermenticellae]|uniref:Rqc2 family fibronectin-binding protein n=1 Tax=Novisyntrophococcus fermenticellae TaxID=2068655 RepID=UPI001E2D72F2|nr:NFACT RNA binding domain-containing protein [Novisyntrophococcus fermenticellae]